MCKENSLKSYTLKRLIRYHLVVTSHGHKSEGGRKLHMSIDGEYLCASIREHHYPHLEKCEKRTLDQFAYFPANVVGVCLKCRRALRRHLRQQKATGHELMAYHASANSVLNLQEAAMFLHLTPKRAKAFAESFINSERVYIHSYRVHARLLEFREYRKIGIEVPQEGEMNNWGSMESHTNLYKIMKADYDWHWAIEGGIKTICVYDADKSLEFISKQRIK